MAVVETVATAAIAPVPCVGYSEGVIGAVANGTETIGNSGNLNEIAYLISLTRHKAMNVTQQLVAIKQTPPLLKGEAVAVPCAAISLFYPPEKDVDLRENMLLLTARCVVLALEGVPDVSIRSTRTRALDIGGPFCSEIPISINVVRRIIKKKRVKIDATLFGDRISGHPPPQLRRIVPIAVIGQFCLVIEIFCGKYCVVKTGVCVFRRTNGNENMRL